MNLGRYLESRRKKLTLLWSFSKFLSRRALLCRLPRFYLCSMLRRTPKYPLFICYYVTGRCNLRCFMCNQGPYNERRGRVDGSKKFLELLDSLPDSIFSLFFSGGEPFLHRDILALIRKAKSKRYHVGIVTNGTLCTPEVIDELVRLRLDYIIFTLHGDRAVHARVTGDEQCYERTTAAVRYYAANNECGTFIVLNSAITPLNYTILDEIVRIGEELGVDFVRFENLNFITGEEDERNRRAIERTFPGVPFLMNQYVTDEILGDMAERVAEMMETSYPIPVAVKPWMTREQLRMWYSPRFVLGRGCDSIQHSLFIAEDGVVTPCNFQRLELGNVFEEGVDAVWHDRVFKEFRSVIGKRLLPGCARCCRL